MIFKTGRASMFAAVGECCSFLLQWRGGGVVLSFPIPRCKEAFEEAGHDGWSHPQNTPLCACRRPVGLFARSEECEHHIKEILASLHWPPQSNPSCVCCHPLVLTIFPLTIQTGRNSAYFTWKLSWYSPQSGTHSPGGLERSPDK